LITTKAVGNDNKIPGISLINNFLFEEGGIRTRKAYNVGPGHYLAYDELSFEKQGDTGLKVVEPISPRTKERGTILESTRPKTDIFACGKTGCVLTFKTEEEADAHMDSWMYVSYIHKHTSDLPRANLKQDSETTRLHLEMRAKGMQPS